MGNVAERAQDIREEREAMNEAVRRERIAAATTRADREKAMLEWEQCCAAMAYFEQQQRTGESPQETASCQYCVQQSIGLVFELPLRCGWHWAAGAACATTTFLCCPLSSPAIALCGDDCCTCHVELLRHHHDMLGLYGALCCNLATGMAHPSICAPLE